jgi:S-formylglutathione hydrolase FrmB
MERGRYLLVLVMLGLAACGGDPDPHGAEIERFSLRAPGGDRLEQIAIRPANAAERPPLLVFLHGRTDGTNGPESNLSDAMLEGLSRLGPSAPAVLLVNGGSSSYYHDRDSGDWGTYVLERAIPEGARRLRADASRIAVGGISMGGFGALHLATREKFCAVGGHSPALWLSGGETPEGAFDDGDDFEEASPFGRGLLARRAWLDVGDEDPFRAATVAYGRERGIRVRVWDGGHEGDYWHAHMASYLRFYARALARCAR